MDEKVSFIPKKTLTKPIYKGSGLGFVLFISLVVLVISGLLFGGAYFYRDIAKGHVDVLLDSFKKAQEILDPALIQQMGSIDAKIENSKDILSQHRAVSPIFQFLETSTLNNVRFSSFDFSYPYTKDAKPILILKGSTRNYANLSLQSDEFIKNKFIKNIIFSNFTLGEAGMVNFTATMEFNPSFFAYKI
ncbi:MAG: hypothetical protein WC587_02740 [Candidatus Paceibacterota bacterium]